MCNKKPSALDGTLLAAALIPIIVYLFVSWGPYPSAWNIPFFGIPSCCIQLLFCRMVRPKIIQTLPLTLSTGFACWQFFIHHNPICIEYQLPAICCICVYIVTQYKNKR